ncbi:hypothetical protein [Nocardia terpenica]|uniref:Uncharacterized protein n=1 Tax=Nocardia terpenica TaxID=455432 RepID=A0A6G9ZDV9_9NOCA|nr:hypothetical protein [Nocardia terpenica]QIS23702.1 hypothetical protein F6W96_40920 [Nocardia terpenica]
MTAIDQYAAAHAVTVLPSAHALIDVFDERVAPASALTDAAHALACLYRGLIADPSPIDERVRERIGELEAQIDTRVRGQRTRCAGAGSRSAGAVIGALAMAWALAAWAREHLSPRDVRLHRVWSLLAWINNFYTDVVTGDMPARWMRPPVTWDAIAAIRGELQR